MMRRRFVLLSALVLFLAASPSEAFAASSDLADRVPALIERLEEARVSHHVPGMSIVVVHDGEVLLARGFGVTNLETGDPVTPETLFMIGSTTKAFTATLAAMMVDAGKIGWDEPLVGYLPYFDPSVDSEEPGAHVTLRDALSHRSGFSRMGPLMTAQGVSAKEMLEVAAKAEPYDAYRKNFHYNNIMYLAAGTAVGEAAGSDWHRLLEKRIFKPLKMKSSSSQRDRIHGTLAPGYAWDEESGTHDVQPILPIDGVGPAGSIVSNAEDMGRWVAFLLAHGEARGKRLVGRAAFEETWKPNITIAQGVEYGMGWMLRTWEGRLMIEHGGNIHGFGAQVGLLPDENLGFALMTNLTATPLQQASLNLVWDTLLGEPEATETGEGAEDLSRYTGAYVANFGSFRDAVFDVSEKDGKLFVNVPGQTDYELKPPNEQGLRPFAVTDTVTVSFEEGPDGAIDMMRMQQSGLNFEIPRQGVEFPEEIDPAELAPFEGTYTSTIFKGDVPVVLKNGRLALEIPNQMAFELRLPDDDGRRAFRVKEVMTVTFDRGEDGSIASLTLRDGDEVVETMPRSGDPDGEPLPTIDEVIAARVAAKQREAVAALGPVRTRGTIRFVHGGLSGTSVEIGDGEHFRSDVSLGKFGWMRTVFGPDHGEMQTHVTPIDPIEGRALRSGLQIRSVFLVPDWREEFEEVQVLKRDTYEDTPVVLVRVSNPDAPGITLYVDPKSGDVLRFDTGQTVPGVNVEVPITIRLEDYREIEGVRIPFRTIVENPESGRTVTQVESIETGVPVCDALFTLAEDGGCD